MNTDEAQRWLAALVDSSYDAIISKSLKGIVTSWNAAAQRIYGYTAEEMIGTSIERVIPTDHTEEFAQIMDRLQQGRRVDHFETVRLRKDGAHIDVSITISPIQDAAGRIIGASTITRDITKQKQVEAALRRREQELTDFIENAAIGIHWIDADGIIVWANQTELDMLGYAREEYVGHYIAEFHVDQQVIASMLNRLANNETLQNYEARLRGKDEGIRYVLINSNVLGEDGQFIHSCCFTRDITERRQIRLALRASEERFRALANAVPTIVWTAAPDGTITFANDQWFHYCGITPVQNAHSWPELVPHPDDQERYLAAWTRALQLGTDYEIEVRNRRYDGAYRWFLTRAVPARDAEGHITAWYGTSTDIHERKLAEEERAQLLERAQAARAEAQEAVRMRDVFLSVASHELKTPLTSLLGNAQLLQRRIQREGTFTARNEHAITVIVEQARRLGKMIAALLDLSRIEMGQLSIEHEPIDVCALVRRVVAEVQPALDQHRVEWVGADTRLLVEGDELRLEQVLQNLIQNAIKYSPEGGLVVVRAERRSDRVYVAVTDQGIGIPSQALPRLFERLYRASNVDGRQISGMGIGLYVVREIIALHGGTVEVRSEEGQGSTFAFYLPLMDQLAAPLDEYSEEAL